MAVRSTNAVGTWWHLEISVFLLVLTTAILIKLGGRIDRDAIPQSGSKTKMRKAAAA
ncbi:MAG: hypothetical protein GY788_17105 [bacterium]|nr:hypothetical protein [bacterium]